MEVALSWMRPFCKTHLYHKAIKYYPGHLPKWLPDGDQYVESLLNYNSILAKHNYAKYVA